MTKNKKSIARNSIFYMVYQVLNVVFPFVSAIYVARVLLTEYVGKVAYAQNIAQYFVILSFLGLPTYGLREVSKVRDQQKALNQLYTELMIINFFSTVFFSVIYLIVITRVNALATDLKLYLITGSLIFANIINNSWLYEGLEEFQYISVRNILFKFFSLMFLILSVKEKNQYYMYASVNVLANVGIYLFNIIKAKQLVHFSIDNLNFKRHLKPIFTLVVVNLAIELYSLVDITMLGMFSNEDSVAFYSYGTKIYKVGLQVISVFTMVVVPRLALYLSQNKKRDYNELLGKTYRIIILLAIPMIAGIEMVSSDLITVLYGEEYIRSSYVLKILAPLLLVSPTGYLLGSRVMLVNNKEKKMAICVLFGAIANIIGNFFLIPILAEIGAAYASFISEMIVMSSYLVFSHKYFNIEVPIKYIKNIVIGNISIIVTVLSIEYSVKNLFLRLIIEIPLAGIIYFGVLCCLKVDIVLEVLNKVKNIKPKKIRWIR